MSLPLAFKTFATTRYHMKRELDTMTHEEMLRIPEQRDDNVLWNVGHLLCSLSRLVYVFSGHPLPIPERYLALFGKNTNARDWEEQPDVQEVLDYFDSLPERIARDYEAGHFKTYEPLKLPEGHAVESVEEAVDFHCFHEGLHIGMVISVKQLLGLPTKGG